MKNDSKMPLNEIVRVAVARAMGSAQVIGELSGNITPGTYEGSVTVKVDFTLDKGADYKTRPTVNLMSRAVIAAAAEELDDDSREKLWKALRKAGRKALKKDKTVAEVLTKRHEEIEAMIDTITEEVVNELPLAPRSGATKVKAEVVRVAASGVAFKLPENAIAA